MGVIMLDREVEALEAELIADALPAGAGKKLNAHLWERDPNDWYIEEEWVPRRLFQAERFEGPIWDPSAGKMTIPHAALAAGYEAIGSDLISRGYGEIGGVDFMALRTPLKMHGKAARSIVTNPPFGIADNNYRALTAGYVSKALRMAEHKVAMILPANWLFGDDRSRWLEATPLRRVWLLTPRPSMPPGAVIVAGVNPGGGEKDFAVFVWLRGYDGFPEMRWLHRDVDA
jgi:hypothetical protein